jgi:hypothetical protein
MPGGNGDFKDEGDGSDANDAIPHTSRWWLAATEFKMFNQGTCDVNWYDG